MPAFLIALLFPALAQAYCEPIHDANAPTVTLGAAGTETLNKAHDRLLALNGAAGGVILVPYSASVICDGRNGCDPAKQCEKLYKFTRLLGKHANITIRGVPGENGEVPSFSCFDANGKGYGTWLSIGRPLYKVGTTIPIDYDDSTHIRVAVEGPLVVSGYNRAALMQAGVERFVVKNATFLDQSGKGMGNQELEGDLRLRIEYCGDTFERGGSNTIDHQIYQHGNKDATPGAPNKVVVVLTDSTVRDPRQSHGFKSTANENYVLHNTFQTTGIWTYPLESTEALDVLACSRNVIHGNTFEWASVYGHTAYMLPRWELQGCPWPDYASGGADEAFYSAVRALGVGFGEGGDYSAATNQYMLQTFVSNNTFRELTTGKAPQYRPIAMGDYGTYPTTLQGACYTQLPTPDNWIRRSVLAVANNVIEGEYNASWFEVRHPNFCGVPPLPQNVLNPVIDVGGNGPTGTPPVALPAWFKTSE